MFLRSRFVMSFDLSKTLAKNINVTTDVRVVTLDHIEQLNRYNERRGQLTKQAVLNALRLAGNEPVPPHFIKQLLDLKALSDKELHKQYEEGNITLQELQVKAKHKMVDKRTIHRKLRELTREKLVDNKGGKYALSINSKSDMRYFAREFGNTALFSFMDSFFPNEKDIEQNISNLIRIFGTYVMYCLIEASRPVSDNIASSAVDMYSTHALISKYLNNVFPTEIMYDYFLGIIKYIFDKNENKEQKYLSLSQQFNNKLPKDKGNQSHIRADRYDRISHISAVEIFRALMMTRMKCLEQHNTTSTVRSGYYYDHNEERQRRQRQTQQYDQTIKEMIHISYELDQATLKLLENELSKMIDAKTFDALNIETQLDTLYNELRRENETDFDELEKLKSDIQRSKPKNKAVLSMIENIQNYFGKR
jgi:hypothetical protein